MDKSKTYLFTVNTDIFPEWVSELEEASDNLMFSRMERPMRLFLRIERMKEVPFKRGEFEVSLPEEVLRMIKKEAERG
ncbi:hypothetical protein A3L04_07995 [Thermococcus chitonophagus]|uniref:Uncharacterized protein n=1 Tax=Thermococcus chitonophagus TaxID=54262 RepID=A0A170SIG7_9EURY|nr:hypothetical protein [Thermococcus chitonophagus]ASJ17015.1 hypothetical protein A3L04_07995 [Thermococcus chitonophagus]CUX77604.1 hypothetical protein CHITON_0825 [Thermococcus chitonophagus]